MKIVEKTVIRMPAKKYDNTTIIIFKDDKNRFGWGVAKPGRGLGTPDTGIGIYPWEKSRYRKNYKAPCIEGGEYPLEQDPTYKFTDERGGVIIKIGSEKMSFKTILSDLFNYR